jgi:signal transduction histidine kinase
MNALLAHPKNRVYRDKEAKGEPVANSYITLIYFLYGLSFFCMGIVILQEVSRCVNARFKQALYFLAFFGILHGIHEWIEMFELLGVMTGFNQLPLLWEYSRQLLLVFSFLPLGIFGAVLLIPSKRYLRLALLIVLIQAGFWSFGLLILRGYYNTNTGLWDVIDVWTRYVVAIPASILACLGLIYQQRDFRRSGLARFGQDSLWAAVAFAWYGLVGQLFTHPSPLPPSNVINSILFNQIFGFPIQLLRAMAALIAAIFVIRFLRSFEVETQQHMDELKAARLVDAQRREALRGELLMRVVAAQEAERQRIARDLHDEIGQSLTALGLGLRAASTVLRPDPDKAVQHMRQLESMTAQSLVELQRLISDLRPSHLDDLGLPAALRWYCGEIQNRSSLVINLEISGDVREIPSQVKMALFRVAQEALTNVVRHAEAKTVCVRLEFLSDVVVLEVLDDGKGFDHQMLEKAQRASWGLMGMEERATLLGGRVEVVSGIGQGTRVKVTIPYHQVEEVDHDHPAGFGG